jgi:hypothetical protein
LRPRGGQEYRAVTCAQHGRGGARHLQETGAYLLTLRGDDLEATGPSGQTRTLSAGRFLEIFGSALFLPPEPTGRLTDLGPLFG